MEKIFSHLENWFSKRPLWLQDAACRIIASGVLSTKDKTELIQICKQEAGIVDPIIPKLTPKSIPKGSLRLNDNPLTFRLKEISDICGINALAPRNPLKFGDSPLTVIYGANGSGKSGYVRVLKHACGARRTGDLHGNVFENKQAEKSCTFKIDNGKPDEIKWSDKNGILDEIRQIEIYDTNCANVYLTEENEVAFEPGLLSLFSSLTGVCMNISQELRNEIDRSTSILPQMPIQYRSTESNRWYFGIDHNVTQAGIDKKCLWEPADEKRLAELNKRLSEPDPANQAKQLRNKKANLLTLHSELNIIREKFTDEKCAKFIEVRDDAISKRKAADEDAKKVFENSPLDGVGTKSWRMLWDQARLYSENEAYKKVGFPNISEEARCVLCQQLLNQNAMNRFSSFEDFVKGGLQKQADTAEAEFKLHTDNIENVILVEQLGLRMDAANITNEKMRNQITDYHSHIIKRKNSLLNAKSLKDLSEIPDDTVLTVIKDKSDKLENQAKKYDVDATGQNRDKLQKDADEHKAKRWLSEQKREIEKEIKRLNEVYLLNKALKLTSTKGLSTKKSDLADLLISSAFIDRFKNELRTLGADRIQIELKKTRTDRGRVYHKLQLKNCANNICTTDILSEGEFRIVSLAVFLADVTAPGYNSPFIFDDPISSLDQGFEEATARRLVSLCGSRQVIVFTHRLSLLALLEEAAKNAGVKPHVICLRSERWGIGEPGDTPIFAKKPQNALNSIRNERLAKARKVLEEIGRAEYESIAKSICSDIRIIIERLIENDLLADVVQRFRRSVQTMGRLHKLAKIGKDDCKLLDDYMSKYSRYEHSQPNEAPVPMPEPYEIENDLKNLTDWLEEFKKR